jgi:pimeloyl-ACP methyl ester carboxylesterase
MTSDSFSGLPARGGLSLDRRHLFGLSFIARIALCVLVFVAAGAVISAADASTPTTRTWTIRYRAWDGHSRRAFVVLPSWYGPHDNPAIPLVISPHGRGVQAFDNVRFWGNLPAVGHFAVVNPEGQGRKLTLYSWGDPGEISDLARMPKIVEHALPWLRINLHRVYAIGGSMGGQETLLLVARDPHEFAGAISFDADTNLALRYRDFALVPTERHLQKLARYEIGGTPSTDLTAYEKRSPIDQARRIAFSGVPLEIWWSTKDKVVINQAKNSRALYDRILQLNPHAPVIGLVGTWNHTAEMWYFRRLPSALAGIGLLPVQDAHPFPRLRAHRATSHPSSRLAAGSSTSQSSTSA